MGEAAAPAKAAARGIIARIIDALLASIGVLFNSAIIMLCIIDANSGINFVEEALYDATPKGPAAKVLMVLLLPITISLYTLVGLALALGFLIVNGWPVMIIHVACAYFFFAQLTGCQQSEPFEQMHGVGLFQARVDASVNFTTTGFLQAGVAAYRLATCGIGSELSCDALATDVDVCSTLQCGRTRFS